MSAAVIQREFLSPPQAAVLLGVDAHKILTWVRSGELRASDLATKRGGRPRYRIARADIEAFLTRRSVVPAPKSAKRLRRRQMDVIQYF